MFSKKNILTAIFIFITSVSAQAQKMMDWTIADYLKNLPEEYKTFSGDFSVPSKDTAIIDEKNGYAAYMNAPPGTESYSSQFPIFEMALFKSETKPPIVVVSNLISDPVCGKYETFFVRRVGSKWTEVKREVLPPMNLRIFWDNQQSAARLLNIIKESSISYQFEPPRQGTRMKVSLEICDFLEDDTPKNKADELSELTETAKPIYLEWDKQNGKFKFAK